MAEFYPGPSYDSASQHPQDYCGHEIHIPIRKHGRQPVFRLSCSMLVTFTNCVTSPAKTMLPVSHLSTVHCVTPSERLCRIGLFLGGGREREREREWPALINWPRVTVNGSQWNEWSPALSLDNRPFWWQGTLFRGREPFWGGRGSPFLGQRKTIWWIKKRYLMTWEPLSMSFNAV